jgi:FkbH-like protein
MDEQKEERQSQRRDRRKSIKCLVWDLDYTLWDGILLEDKVVSLREGVVPIIKALDSRGILQSVASRNEYDTAMQQLAEFGLDEYFLYPQITWGSKAASIKTIAQRINIGQDTIAFIDDQQFEREEVQFSLPEVLCIDAADLDKLLDMPEMNPRFITEDSKMRRQMYLSDAARRKVEEEFVGPQESFLASLEMVFTLFRAQKKDLQRAEELTVRTNQLNATGYTYSYDELLRFSRSDQYLLLGARLEDKFGTYGHIGLALVECQPALWTIKLLLMSCRVMSRGVGSIMLNYIMTLAKQAGARLQAEFIPSGRNRLMEITYGFAGFHEVEQINDLILYETDLRDIQRFPEYVEIRTDNLALFESDLRDIQPLPENIEAKTDEYCT